MTTLVQVALTVRRTARASYGVLAASAFAALDLLGVFQVPLDELDIEHALVGAAWLTVFGARATARFRREDDPAAAPSLWLDLELGLLLLVAVHAAVQLGGGLAGPLYPLVYVLVAFVASFARKPAGAIFV